MCKTNSNLDLQRTFSPSNLSTENEAVFDSLAEQIVYQDSQMRIVWANKAAGDSLGLTKEELVGRHCYNLWHQRSEPCEGCPVAKAFETGEPHRGEIKSPDGRVWFVRAYPVHNGDGKVIGVIELTLDITERKEAELALQESEENYRSLYETALVGWWRTRIEDGMFLKANPALVRALGFGEESELVGKHSAAEFYSTETRKELVRQLKEYSVVSQFETRFTLKDGTIKDTLLSAKIHPEKGYIQGTIIDITERKQAEELLRQSERKFRNLVETMTEGLAISDFDENLLFVNAAASDIFGYTSKELVGMNLRELAEPDEMDRIQRETSRRKKGLSSRYEMTIRRKDGQIRNLVLSATPYHDETGNIEGALGVFFDITGRKRAEKEKKKLREQLVRAQRMESLGVLAGGVAHDLNNILGPLVAYPEMILMKLPADSPARKQIQMLGKSARDAAEVIQDLLTLARRGRYEMGPISLNEVVESYLASPNLVELKERCPHVEIEEKLSYRAQRIMGSSAHLMKVIMNLVVNAFDAMPNGGKLTLEISESHLDRLDGGYTNITRGDYVILRVRDTGIGIEEKHLKHIFEPYYSKKEMGSSGSGLGLSVVYGIVKDHNGYYDVKSRVGEGTEFILYFPICKDEAPESGERERDYSGTETVLVIDDVEEQRQTAAELLSSLGYKVESVCNGREAVKYLTENTADIILLDMIMEKDFDGLDTYTEILKLRPHQKAIIISGFSATERVSKTIELGASQYIRKPYTLMQIGKAIREELNREKTQAAL